MQQAFFEQVMHSNGIKKETITAVTPVHGGDINESFHIRTTRQSYFIKLQSTPQGSGMLTAEAAGLNLLRQHFQRIPHVLGTGHTHNTAWLLLEWIEKKAPAPNLWTEGARNLAMLHRQSAPTFGWQHNNYIGTLPQSNQPHTQWADFYLHCRIQPLLEQGVASQHFHPTILQQLPALSNAIHEQFPSEPPALLHGDLWGGNIMSGPDGQLWLFDPAPYFGHREMDLAMTRLFGGFDHRLYEAYNHHYPLAPGWPNRIRLCQLYPILVHALLFQGHYIREAQRIIEDYTA